MAAGKTTGKAMAMAMAMAMAVAMTAKRAKAKPKAKAKATAREGAKRVPTAKAPKAPAPALRRCAPFPR